MSEDAPSYAGELVSERDGKDVVMQSLLRRFDPRLEPIALPILWPDVAHVCKLGFEGIVSKRKDSVYRSGRSPDWLKMKNPDAPAVTREAEEEWGKKKWR